MTSEFWFRALQVLLVLSVALAGLVLAYGLVQA